MGITDTFEVLDGRFRRYAMGNVHMETLHAGTRWAEGPAYVPAGRYLVWSDIPNDRVLRWDECTGTVGESNAERGAADSGRKRGGRRTEHLDAVLGVDARDLPGVDLGRGRQRGGVDLGPERRDHVGEDRRRDA